MATEAEAQRPLRIFMLPLMAPGHMNPMLSIAKLLSLRGPTVVDITVITTPKNEPLVGPFVASFPNISVRLVPFPASVSHLLRGGHENLSSLNLSDLPSFFTALYALQKPIEELLFLLRPDCVISDYMFAWTSETALRLDIPRLVFYGHGNFANCVHESLHVNAPYMKENSFVVEGLPHRIEMTRAEVSSGVMQAAREMVESVEKSYGVVVNSFYELESEYAELYRLARRAYYVGPVAILNKDRGERPVDHPEIEGLMAAWLDSMEKGSVVYVCFGSLNEFSTEQLLEIAAGLEASGHGFVWAAKKMKDEALPDGFEERVKGKGAVIRGWAPQTAILHHRAVGGFMTHCGWNSTLESISAGVPMVTWPVEYEQFVNEKLITQVLDIGVSVRGGEPVQDGKKTVKAEEIAMAVKVLMGDEEAAEKRRERARNYAKMAKEAMEEGGSSYEDMTRLIDDIKELSLGNQIHRALFNNVIWKVKNVLE